ncbi:MAG: glycosyltransferase family 2 protein [bacterium]|jgi:glycosyltransferase involved in cell wall biosynthesis
MIYPLVSIIIPVYNGEQFLSVAIESAIQQTWLNKEIIIVDDGSEDESLSIAKSYESEWVKVIHVNNGGAARARNIGFQYSKGDFIQYLDADDLLAKNKIELQLIKILKESDPVNIVCAGQWLRFTKSLDHLIGGIGPGGRVEQDMDPLDWLLMRPYNLMTIHGWLTPRNLINKAGPWNESMTLDDDGEFFIRVIKEADRIIFCAGAMSYYRTLVNNSSTLSTYSGLTQTTTNCVKLKSAFKSLETYKLALLSLQHSKNVKAALARNFLYMAFNSYLVCDEVYVKSIKQPEIPFFQRFTVYKWIGGKFGILVLLFGWKNAKKLALAKNVNAEPCKKTE